MTRNETHVHDLSTLANFKDWAMSVGAALTAFGWTKTADTGQVDWTSIASVPTSNNYVYEIWQPGDGKTPYYVRIDYGNQGGSSPGMKFQAGTATNGSGTITGFNTGTQWTCNTTGNSGGLLYNCLYQGDSSCFSIMLWRDLNNGGNVFFAADRSRDATGATTNSYFTLFCVRDSSHNSGTAQQSIMFGVGAAPLCAGSSWGLNCIIPGSFINFSGNSTLFNGNFAITPVFPMIGYHDIPTLAVIHAAISDFNEAAVLTVTLLGATHSFLFSKNQNFGLQSNYGTAMRWE